MLWLKPAGKDEDLDRTLPRYVGSLIELVGSKVGVLGRCLACCSCLLMRLTDSSDCIVARKNRTLTESR